MNAPTIETLIGWYALAFALGFAGGVGLILHLMQWPEVPLRPGPMIDWLRKRAAWHEDLAQRRNREANDILARLQHAESDIVRMGVIIRDQRLRLDSKTRKHDEGKP